MNATQAKENIKPYGMVDSIHLEARSEIELVEKACKWATARGYLEALKGPEVRGLVQALEAVKKEMNPSGVPGAVAASKEGIYSQILKALAELDGFLN